MPHALYITLCCIALGHLHVSFWLYSYIHIHNAEDLYFTAGPPQKVSCQCQCPVVHRSGTSDRCTLMWESPTIVSCSSLQINVSLTLPNGIPLYSDCFGQSITSIQTIPLSANSVYTATITDECGSMCSVNCSTVPIDGKSAARY